MTTMADNKDKKVLNVPHLRFPEFSGEWEETTLGKISEESFISLRHKSLQQESQEVREGVELTVETDILISQLNAVFDI